MNHNQISHDGVVESVTQNKVNVRITAESACAQCHAKNACISLDTKEKIIEVYTEEYASFHVGDAVVVSTDRTSGHKAVIIGYVLPFIILLITLLVVLELTHHEMLAGLSAISSVAGYYGMIYLVNRKFQHTFRFYIRHR